MNDINKHIRELVQKTQGKEIAFYYDTKSKSTSQIEIGESHSVSIERPINNNVGIFHTHPKLAPSTHRVCYPSLGDLLTFKDNKVEEAKIYCQPTKEIYTYEFTLDYDDKISDFELYDEITNATEEAKYEPDKKVCSDHFCISIE